LTPSDQTLYKYHKIHRKGLKETQTQKDAQTSGTAEPRLLFDVAAKSALARPGLVSCLSALAGHCWPPTPPSSPPASQVWSLLLGETHRDSLECIIPRHKVSLEARIESLDSKLESLEAQKTQCKQLPPAHKLAPSHSRLYNQK
jgi:hypothetical protein